MPVNASNQTYPPGLHPRRDIYHDPSYYGRRDEARPGRRRGHAILRVGPAFGGHDRKGNRAVKLVSSARDLRRGVPSGPLRLATAAGLAALALGGLSACADNNPEHRSDFPSAVTGQNPTAQQSLTGAPPEATVVSSPTPTAVPSSAQPTASGSPKSARTSATPSPAGSPTP